MPRHCLLPFVNETMYRVSCRLISPFSIHRSGLNFSGSGKMLGSWWIKYDDELRGVYFC